MSGRKAGPLYPGGLPAPEDNQGILLGSLSREPPLMPGLQQLRSTAFIFPACLFYALTSQSSVWSTGGFRPGFWDPGASRIEL